MSGRPLIEKREPAPTPLGRWYLAFLGRLTPMQRELWLEHAHFSIVMASISVMFASVVFANSDGNVFALSLTLWAAPIGGAAALKVSTDMHGWKKTVHTLPVSQAELYSTFWWIYVVAIPTTYSLFANVAFVFAGHYSGVSWPWYRVVELPYFYCGIHAALYVCVGAARKLDGCLVVLIGVLALPAIFNAHSLFPDVWWHYPPLCIGALVLSYRWRDRVFRFDPADFQRAPDDDDDPELDELLKDESDPEVVEMMRDDSVSFLMIRTAVWEKPRPFRALFIDYVRNAVLMAQYACVLAALLTWLFGIRFETSAFPSVAALFLSCHGAHFATMFAFGDWVKVARTLPIASRFLTRFMLGMLGAIYIAGFLSTTPWLYFVWSQTPVAIAAALMYGAGLTSLLFCVKHIAPRHGATNRNSGKMPASMVAVGFITLALIAAPLIARSALLILSPIVFIAGMVTLVYTVRRYQIP